MIPDRRRAQALLTRKGRKEHSQFLLEGVRLVEEAIDSGNPISRIYHTTPPPGTRLARLLARAEGRGVRLAEITQQELRSISDAETPQGVVAIADIPAWSDDNVWGRNAGDIVLLDNVRDPGNVGTLFRAAEAAGARSIVSLSGTVETTNPKVVRSAMGALFRLPHAHVSLPEEAARLCHEAGLQIVNTSVRDGDPASALLDIGSIALVLGGEAEGSADVWGDLADRTVHIPMKGSVESLNVAVAGSILLFRKIWR